MSLVSKFARARFDGCVTNVITGRLIRILEKQNRVQMSQVLFRGPRSSHQVVLLFKDSKARPLGPADATSPAAYLPLASLWV